jgi:protein phosphatase
MTMRHQSAGYTVTGKIRKHNEDAILVREDVGLWVVADGMGGHSAGDYASAMIIERLGALARPDSVLDFIESIEDALVQVNTDLVRTAVTRGVDIIGSTVVVLVHDRDFMLCGWVGDSRVYCFEDGQLRQITSDHVHGMKDEVTQFGGMPAQPQPGAGALTRAVGAEDQLFVEWVVTGCRPGMLFVLCSDGISSQLTDEEMRGCLLDCQGDLPRASMELVDLANARGGEDNATVVLVAIV